ncbi:MAG: chromosome segregation protein SMC [Pseudomonadota bacterium]
MQITQIRIAGFKSFVDPTDVPIEEGLTGIVGPNGCGKSNLLEALRWAMGASSAKAMRGSEMDDLIFSGSSDRPARETAEVTLVLDNADRKAPPEFNSADTLEILRRLKRGAGSTYKLNGRTVRGKDIQLLFADASTGANSPALVRQGQISELIAAKPQNRRRILEEAAGISGLNTRRHEAELKLRAAESNLERLTEVSAEVERQLESLKRQARKARKYKALSDEINGLEALAAHLRWQEAIEASELANSALVQARQNVEELTSIDAIREKERLEAAEKLPPLREAESVISAKLGQARIAFARRDAERKAAAEAIGRLEEELGRLNDDLTREQAMVAEAEAEAERSKEELVALPQENAAANDAEEASARATLDQAREALRKSEAIVDQLSDRLSDSRAQRRAAEENLASQRRRRDELARQKEAINRQLSTLQAAEELSLALREAETAEAEAEQAYHAATKAVEIAEAEQEAAAEKAKDAEAPVSNLETAIRALEGEIAGLERLLKTADRNDAPPVLERIRVKDGLEKAIAAAFGDDLQASTDRSTALHWAGAEKAGSQLPGASTPLTELVDAPDELLARLSQCGLVDAAQGAELCHALKPGQRLVSKEGHLWRWDGFVRTPDAPVSAAEKLEQQTRLEAAKAEFAPLQDQIDQARKIWEAAKATLDASDKRLKDARTAVPTASSKWNETRSTAAKAREAYEAANLKRSTFSDTISRIETDLRISEDAIGSAQGLGEQETDKALEEELARAREALITAREAEVEARGNLTDFTRGREQAAARRKHLTRDFETWTERAKAASSRAEKLQERSEDTRRKIATTKQTDGGPDADELAALESRVQALENERKTAADSLAEAETAAREAEEASRAATAAAGKAREALAGATVAIEASETRVQDSIETARSQFQRLPEGLMPLAKTYLDEDVIASTDLADAAQKAEFLKRDRDQLGGVNMDAEAEAEEVAERLGAQANEKQDLTKAITKLREGVDALNDEGRARLIHAFETVNEHFKSLFRALFRGGQAELRLVDADDPLAAGLEIFAQPPGKRLGTLRLMSGGEQALTAAALIFAVFLSNPAPVCVLDEVDAPLDDANVDRFCRMLDEMRNRTNTRFIVITHNPVTMSRMDRLFGVTMREKGVSKLVSVDLSAAEELVAAE